MTNTSSNKKKWKDLENVKHVENTLNVSNFYFLLRVCSTYDFEIRTYFNIKIFNI